MIIYTRFIGHIKEQVIGIYKEQVLVKIALKLLRSSHFLSLPIED